MGDADDWEAPPGVAPETNFRASNVTPSTLEFHQKFDEGPDEMPDALTLPVFQHPRRQFPGSLSWFSCCSTSPTAGSTPPSSYCSTGPGKNCSVAPTPQPPVPRTATMAHLERKMVPPSR